MASAFSDSSPCSGGVETFGGTPRVDRATEEEDDGDGDEETQTTSDSSNSSMHTFADGDARDTVALASMSDKEEEDLRPMFNISVTSAFWVCRPRDNNLKRKAAFHAYEIPVLKVPTSILLYEDTLMSGVGVSSEEAEAFVNACIIQE